MKTPARGTWVVIAAHAILRRLALALGGKPAGWTPIALNFMKISARQRFYTAAFLRNAFFVPPDQVLVPAIRLTHDVFDEFYPMELQPLKGSRVVC